MLNNSFITGGTFQNVSDGGVVNHYISAPVTPSTHEPGFQVLIKHVSTSALHNSGEVNDQPKCHPGTRVAILEELLHWATLIDYPYPIKWLHGPAGSGKSSILRTLAEQLFKMKLLVASFFFFRAGVGRNSSENFVATIAYQLAMSIPATRLHIGQAVTLNPIIFSLSLAEQVQTLIFDPLLVVCGADTFSPSKRPRIIIIDGLDECRDSAKQCEILDVLCAALQALPVPFALLIASRPEHHIRAKFDLGLLNHSSSRLILDDSYEPDADIRKFLIDEFQKIRRYHQFKAYLPSSQAWPKAEILQKLVDKASGQFIYASTVIKFVGSIRHNPANRLDVILGDSDVGPLKPFEALDLLYSTIFMTIDAADLAGSLRVLGVLLVPQTRPSMGFLATSSPRFLELLLGLGTGEVRQLLFDLESLLSVGTDKNDIRIFHASLADFLFDKRRSGQYYIDAGFVYEDLSKQCLSRYQRFNGTSHIEYIFENVHSFLEMATPTMALHNAIYKVEIKDLVKVVDHQARPVGLSFLCPHFLTGIKVSAVPDADILFARHLSFFEEHLFPILDSHFADIYRKSFLTIMVMIVEQNHLAIHNCLEMPLFTVHGVHNLSQTSNPLCSLWTDIQKLIPFIRNILCDPHRGRYFIKEDDYADMALYFMKFICKEDINFMTGEVPIKKTTRRPAYVTREDGQYIPPILAALLLRSPPRSDLIEYMKRNKGMLVSQMRSIENEIEEYTKRSIT